MNKKGFTLVEILAVIVILGILVTIAMTTIVPKINQSKKETFIINAKNILKTANVLFEEKQALNDLPNITSHSVEGIYKIYETNYFYEPNYKVYAIDIDDLRNIMDIKKDYAGYVFFADYGEYVKSSINLSNKDFVLLKKDCLYNNINMCFLSEENLKLDLVLNKKENNIKPMTWDRIRKSNIYYICPECKKK